VNRGGANPQSRDERIDAAIAAYLVAIQNGVTLNDSEWLAGHRDLAPELEEFLADRAHLRSVLGPLRADVVETSKDTAAPAANDTSLSARRDAGQESQIELPSTIGDYDLFEEIARGGMGVVFRARQRSLNRVVALKMILGSRSASRTDLERFRREAEDAAQLDHPNIVPIYDVSEIDGRPFFSMKFIEGGDLRRHSERLGADPGAVARLMMVAARAVHHAHQHGIMHRDLKPSNVLLDRTGQPHIADFGLAKRITGDESPSLSGDVIGTPAYMAPEQTRGNKQLTTAVDVYGLGAILYELLAGQPPFRGESAGDTLLSVLTEEPVPPSRLRPGVPCDLETICLKCLQKDPSQRYGSAEALADELQRFLENRPIRARPVSSRERAWRWCRRNPALVGLFAASLLAALALVGLAVGMAFNGRLQTALNDVSVQKKLADEQRLAAELLRDRSEHFEIHVRYARDMNLAYQAWNDSRLARFSELLDAWIPASPEAEDHRGWEWHYLDSLRRKDVRTLTTGERNCSAAITADGKWLAVGTLDKSLFIWDFETGELRHRVPTFPAELSQLAFDSKGRWLAAASRSGDVTILDPVSGTTLKKLSHPQMGRSVAISHDGRWLASGTWNGKVVLWDTETWTRSKVIDESKDWIDGLAFEPRNHKLLAIADRGGVAKILSFAESQWVRDFRGHRQQVSSVAFSPDGQRLLTGGEDQSVKVWSLATGGMLANLTGHSAFVRQVAFSRDGQLTISCSDDGTVRVWDAQLRERGIYRGHRDAIMGLAVHPDGRRLVTCGNDGSVKVWDLAAGHQEFRAFPEPDTVRSIAFSSDARQIVVGAFPRLVTIRDADCGELLRTFAGQQSRPELVAFGAADELIIAVGDGGLIRVWNAADGKPVRSLSAANMKRTTCALHPDGRILGYAEGDHVICRCDLRGTGEPAKTRCASAIAHFLVWHPDGRRLVTGGAAAALLDGATGETIRRYARPGAEVRGAAISKDGRLLALADNFNVISLWDVEAGTELRTFKGHSDLIYQIDFHPDGNRLVSASTDRTVRLWDVATGLEVLNLRGFDHIVYGAAFSRDGQQLAVCGAFLDRVRIYDRRPQALPRDSARAWRLRELEACVDSNNLPGALFHAEFLVKAFPNDGNIYVRRGWVNQSLGFTDAAVADFSKAIDLGTTDPDAWYHRGMQHSRAKKNDLAAMDFENYVRLKPDDPRGWRYLGEFHALTGKWKEAAVDFRNAIDTGFNTVPMWQSLAICLFASGDQAGYARASSEVLERFARADSQIGQTIQLGYICRLAPIAKGEAQTLIARLKKGREADPGNTQIVHPLGWMLCRTGQYAEGVAVLKDAVATPGPEWLRFEDLLFLGLCYHHLGKTAEARQRFDEARKIAATSFPLDWRHRQPSKALRDEVEALLSEAKK
jgi:WD40 repeat protein/Flp pilus assembly protein TadD